MLAVGGVALFVRKEDLFVEVFGEIFQDNRDGVEDHHEAGNDRVEVVAHDVVEFGNVDG
jgi:hypothetical protein